MPQLTAERAAMVGVVVSNVSKVSKFVMSNNKMAGVERRSFKYPDPRPEQFESRHSAQNSV
jgi:hypothetical protein